MSAMLAVRASPDIPTSFLFLDTPGSGPSSAPYESTHLIDPVLAGETSTVKRATKSRSRSTTPAGEKRYKCQYEGCDKAYTKPSRLSEHELSHTGERRHACPHCENTYLRANHLHAHLRTHLPDDEKPFACDREGCDMRFWTAPHLRRHLDVHDKAEVYQCEQCDASFVKAHLLRDHIVSHMAPGTKPYFCTHEGCTWSFATKQKLKAHEKTHEANRYTCSHPSHDVQPSFAKWSLLQSHIHQAHPPICPHAECHGRIFKNAQRLRDHLKVHDQRTHDLHVLSMTPALDADSDDNMGAGKRKRRKSAATVEDGSKSPKLRRVNSGEAGKNFACPEEGCEKRFKTAYALKTHHKVVHLKLRSHICPVDGCGQAYAHMANLKQHIAAHERAVGPNEVQENTPAVGEDHAEMLTGNIMALKRYGCPIARIVRNELANDARCCLRFWRVYDVRRHLKAEHDMDLEDAELRELLREQDTEAEGHSHQA